MGADGERQRPASMRPQHITAENLVGAYAANRAIGRFNEAAAYHCGKLAGVADGRVRAGASMRPQHITAENLRAEGRIEALRAELQ